MTRRTVARLVVLVTLLAVVGAVWADWRRVEPVPARKASNARTSAAQPLEWPHLQSLSRKQRAPAEAPLAVRDLFRFAPAEARLHLSAPAVQPAASLAVLPTPTPELIGMAEDGERRVAILRVEDKLLFAMPGDRIGTRWVVRALGIDSIELDDESGAPAIRLRLR